MPLKSKKPPQSSDLALRARDGIRIAARHWRRPGTRNLIVMVPGFGQNKDTPIMRRCADIFSDYGDVLCLDLRGTGKSEGRYHFGAGEELDVQAALLWAKSRYGSVELMGFSMGAYISLRAAVDNPKLVQRLFFVSGPTRIDDIVLTLGPIRQAIVRFNPEVRKVSRWAGMDMFFRWGSIFRSKPRGQDLAAALKVPISLLVGSRDQLVLPKLSHRVFEAAASKKVWTVFEGGFHAEYLAVMREVEFRAWILKSRKVLGVEKKGKS